MITDKYFTDKEFEKKDLNKRFILSLLIIPVFVLIFWAGSYVTYDNYDIKPIYLFIYNCLKYFPLLILLLLITHRVKYNIFERLNPYLGITIIFLFMSPLILFFLSVIFTFQGNNSKLLIDTVFTVSLVLFILYYIVYYFRYMTRAKLGREEYINQLKGYHYILDNQSKVIEHNYFRIKNKKLEEKLDVLAVFIKVLTPAIVTISVMIGYTYIEAGEGDPAMLIVAFAGVIGSAYFGSLMAIVTVTLLNLSQIEKQIGIKIYSGLYPETIARKKAEAKENVEYWEKRLEEEENKKSKK